MSFTDGSVHNRWIRVLRLDSEAWIGLSGTALFVGDAEGPKRRLDEQNPIGLLPCLERPYATVVSDVKQREIELALAPSSLVMRLPLRRVPHVAIATRMDYWVLLALDWFENMDADASDAEAVAVVAGASWASQSARHRARGVQRVLAERGTIGHELPAADA